MFFQLIIVPPFPSVSFFLYCCRFQYIMQLEIHCSQKGYILEVEIPTLFLFSVLLFPPIISGFSPYFPIFLLCFCSNMYLREFVGRYALILGVPRSWCQNVVFTEVNFWSGRFLLVLLLSFVLKIASVVVDLIENDMPKNLDFIVRKDLPEYKKYHFRSYRWRVLVLSVGLKSTFLIIHDP